MEREIIEAMFERDQHKDKKLMADVLEGIDESKGGGDQGFRKHTPF